MTSGATGGAPGAAGPATARPRIIDLDVTRAVALIGVALMNYHGSLVNAGGEIGDSVLGRFFDPFDGPLASRFAATFTVVAGMGITLLTARSRASGDRLARSDDRWRLIRRGFLLYAFGYVFDWIWGGTILFFYGAMFMIGAVLFVLRSRWLLVIGAGAAIGAAAIRWWAFEWSLDHHGAQPTWLFAPGGHSPRGLLFDTFVNGTHPLLPWLAYLCAGMVLGRILPLTSAWRARLIVIGVAAVVITYVLRTVFDRTTWQRLVLSVDHWDRSLNYTVGTLGSSIAAVCVIGAIAERTQRSPVTRALATTGRTTLTLYIGHALAFRLLVDWWGVVTPGGLGTSLTFALAYWVLAVLAAAWWARWFGMGPCERIYRRFGGDPPHPWPEMLTRRV